MGWIKGEPKRFIAGHVRPSEQDAKERFQSKIAVDGSGCWEWLGATGTGRYGVFNFKGKCVSAHRFAYETFVGPIPDGAFVLHSCDNRWCVNPGHLRPGTAAENTREARERGRLSDPPVRHGERHYNSKLCEQQVREIRSLFDEGWRPTDIGRAYSAHPGNITKIGRRESWRHLDEKVSH